MTRSTPGEIIALVSCVKGKAPGPCAAKDLYLSTLFKYARAYAEQNADRWFVLSAKHGLVDPERALAPYEQTLNGRPARIRREWAERMFDQMNTAGLLYDRASFLWLAGRNYTQYLTQLLNAYQQRDPLRGRAFGDRLKWLKKATRSSTSDGAPRQT